MIYGIKDLKTIKEVDKMLIKAIRLFNDAATMVEDLRIDLRTKTIREETHKIMHIASNQQKKLENMRDKLYYSLKKR